MKSYLALLIGSAALALALNSASAEPPAAANGDETKSVLLCTPETSEFRISVPGTAAPHAYAHKELFNASVLINVGHERRTGTRRKHFQCGGVSIDVHDFALLTLARGSNRIEVSLVEDSCADAASSRAQAAWGPNPVQAIEGHLEQATGAYQLTLFKSKCDDSGNGKPISQIVTWR